jgi:hypothetical protein
MKNIKTPLFVLLLLLFVPGISGADATASSKRFINGLWQGIDTEDGSETLISISDNDHDGILDIRLTDTFFSSCVGYEYSGSPGLVDGPATFHNKTLSWAFSFKCYNPGTNELVEVEQGNASFVYNRQNKTLVDESGNIFYRVDRR